MSDPALGPAAIEAFLHEVPLFKGCEPQVIAKLASALEVLTFKPGASIIRAGATPDGLYILHRGLAQEIAESVIIETLRPPDTFGESGALLNVPHVHSVIAEQPCVALKLPANALNVVVARVPAFSVALSRRLAARLNHAAPAPAGVPSPRPSAPSPGAARASPGQGPGAGVIAFVGVNDFDINGKVLSLVPARVILQHRLLPLKLEGTTLTVGMVTPRNLAALGDLQRVLHGVELQVVAISIDDYNLAVARVNLGPGAAKAPDGSKASAEPLVFDTADSEREAEKSVRVVGDDVVRIVTKMVTTALERDASDIHVEPEAAAVRVRFRVQGVLEDWAEPVPQSLGRGIAARFKVLAGLDVTERRKPQDGRIGLTWHRREVDLRVASVPASRGEKIVLRICDAASTMRSLDSTFVEPNSVAHVRKALNQPAGAVIIAGSTGSGKTSTLYSILNERRTARPDTNIVTVEDPIEYRLPGITQIQVNSAIELGFPQVLRAILRQDPDTIAVGETRDAETAHLALEAAITGHLLFTSIHASTATAVIQRFESLGCSRALIAQGLALVVVQRLVPKLCSACVQVDAASPVLVDALVAARLIEKKADAGLPRAVGCDNCGHTGYSGRIAAIEMLAVNDDVRAVLMTAATLGEVERAATQARLFIPFRWYAGHLLGRKLIAATDALHLVA